MRPWVTDYVINPAGDHEVQVTYPDGKTAWVTVPYEAVGQVDPVDLAEASERHPPATLARPGGRPANSPDTAGGQR